MLTIVFCVSVRPATVGALLYCHERSLSLLSVIIHHIVLNRYTALSTVNLCFSIIISIYRISFDSPRTNCQHQYSDWKCGSGRLLFRLKNIAISARTCFNCLSNATIKSYCYNSAALFSVHASNKTFNYYVGYRNVWVQPIFITRVPSITSHLFRSVFVALALFCWLINKHRFSLKTFVI